MTRDPHVPRRARRRAASGERRARPNRKRARIGIQEKRNGRERSSLSPPPERPPRGSPAHAATGNAHHPPARCAPGVVMRPPHLQRHLRQSRFRQRALHSSSATTDTRSRCGRASEARSMPPSRSHRPEHKHPSIISIHLQHTIISHRHRQSGRVLLELPRVHWDAPHAVGLIGVGRV